MDKHAAARANRWTIWEEFARGTITPQMYCALEYNSNLNHSQIHRKYSLLQPAESKVAKEVSKGDQLAEVNAGRQHIGFHPHDVMEQEFTITRTYTSCAHEKHAKQQPYFDVKREMHFK